MIAKLGRRMRRIGWKDVSAVVVPVLIGLLVALVLVWKHDGDARDRQRQSQINGLSRSNDALRKQVQQLGARPVAPPAGEVKQHPDQPIPSPSATAVGPSQNEVDAAVAAYCDQATQPCRGPGVSVAQLAAAAANWLQAHPPAAGPKGDPAPPPTADQMFTAVATYCGQDSAPCKGPKGDKGDPGPGPTADQLAQAVHDYVQANPLPLCPDGTSATAETVLTVGGPVDAVICVRS